VNWKGYIRPRAGIHKPEIGHFFGGPTAFFPGILGGAGPGDAAMHKEAEREFKSADPAAGRASEATFAQDVLYLLRELL
jgi:hypothetical protein